MHAFAAVPQQETPPAVISGETGFLPTSRWSNGSRSLNVKSVNDRSSAFGETPVPGAPRRWTKPSYPSLTWV